jgi:hypothetical protein
MTTADILDRAREAFARHAWGDAYALLSAAARDRWVRQRGERIIPIVGVRKLDQLQDILSSLDVELSPNNCCAWTRRAGSSWGSRTTSSVGRRVRWCMATSSHKSSYRVRHPTDGTTLVGADERCAISLRMAGGCRESGIPAVAVPESVTCKTNQGSAISIKASPNSEIDLPTQRRPNAG